MDNMTSENSNPNCPRCGAETVPEHAHNKCPNCGYIIPCCEPDAD